MNVTVRSLFSITMLGLVALVGGVFPQTLLTWSGLAALALLYLGLIWSPLEWWSGPKYGLVAALSMTISGLLRYSAPGPSGHPASLLLVPLILLLAREQGAQSRLAALLAALALLGMAALAPVASFLWAALPIVIAAYMSIRAIHIYKDAYRLSQQNVQELQAAHQELLQTYTALQEETVQSMRYAALAERTRLAREIHDGLGHQLTSLIVQLQALEIMLPGDPARAAQSVPEMLAVARKSMAEVRRAVETWREDEHGAGLAALQGLVSQVGAYAPFRAEFHAAGEFSDWPVELSVALYRILQEALTNILRHAQATAASIQVQEQAGQVTLTVADDGCYRAGAPLTPGYGIKGIRERSQALGGECRIIPNHPHGLTLQVSLPIQPAYPLSGGSLPGGRLSHGK